MEVRAKALEDSGHYAAAAELYRNALARVPRTDTRQLSRLNVEIGQCYLKQGRTNEAFFAFHRAAEYDDSNAVAHHHLGELYLEFGDVQNAAEQAKALLRTSGVTADSLTLLGSAASASGNDDVAIESFVRVLQIDPRRVKTAILLADIYARNDKLDAARSVLGRAAMAQPSSAAPWLALGRLEEQEGELESAEVAYRKAVSVENTTDTNLRVAQFLERAARVDEAQQFLAAADARQESTQTAVADYAALSGQSDEAERKYLSALDALKSPKSGLSVDERRRRRATIVARLIETDLQRKDGAARAKVHLQELGSDLDRPTAQILGAEVELGAGDLPRAAELISEALKLVPDSAPAHYVSGVLKQRTGDNGGALAEWQLSLNEDTMFVPARMAIAESLLHDGDAKEAQTIIVPVVRQEPGNLKALLLFGRILTARKDFVSAQVIAHRAEAIGPDLDDVAVFRGEIAEARQRPGEALLQYQRAVLMNPQSRPAIDGLIRVYRSGHVTRPMLQQMERTGMSAPVSPTLLEIAGRLYADRGWNDDAQRCLRASVGADPSRSSALQSLAEVMTRKGADTTLLNSSLPLSKYSAVLAGLQAEQRKETASAMHSYDEAVRAGDRSGVAANNLAWMLAQQGKELDRAATLAETARNLQPSNPAVLDTVGYVRLVRREFTSAISVLEEARQIATGQHEDASVLSSIDAHLAEAYLRAGETARARMLSSGLRAPARRR